MNITELKISLMNPNRKFVFGVPTNKLILELESLLIDNGYEWRGHEKKFHYLKERWGELKSCLIYINMTGIEPNVLSFCPLAISNLDEMKKDCDFLITEESIKQLYFYFDPIPDYKPKKIIREI